MSTKPPTDGGGRPPPEGERPTGPDGRLSDDVRDGSNVLTHPALRQAGPGAVPETCPGFPEGVGCGGEIRYPTLRLCNKCYQARRRHLVRLARDQPPGVLLTPAVEEKEPHECPLCGHELDPSRARRPSVRYDPHTHPLRLRRALAVQESRSSIAERFGITEAELNTWIEQFPAMRAAVVDVAEESHRLYEAAVMKALGPVSQTGQHVGGDTALLKMLIADRHRITERKPETTDTKERSREEMTEIALKLIKNFDAMGITGK